MTPAAVPSAWPTACRPESVRPVRRIAGRCRTATGQWGTGVLISTLDPAQVLLASVSLSDQRGSRVDTSFKGDQQGLGSTTRLEALLMVMVLGALAHHVVIWACGWLAPAAPRLRRSGIVRVVRDVLPISGFLVLDALGQCVQSVLNRVAPLASLLVDPFRELLAPMHVALHMGQT
jgi:hypothetical protein